MKRADGRAFGCLLVALTLCLASCGAGPRPVANGPTPQPGGLPRAPAAPAASAVAGAVGSADGSVAVLALLADHRLLAIRERDGALLGEVRLAPAPPSAPERIGHPTGVRALALDREQRHLFALITGAGARADRVVKVEIASLAVVGSYALDGGGVYRSLAVGPTSGRVYAFGYQLPATSRIVALDPADGTTIAAWSAGRATDMLYQGGVSPDEQRFFLSFHSTGIDWYEVDGGTLRHCEDRALALRGCLRAHGGFALRGDTILVATGDRVLLEFELAGGVRRGFDSGLDGRHLADFVIDERRRSLYAVGSCAEGGGFSVMDLAAGGTLPAGGSRPAGEGEWTWQSAPPAPALLVIGVSSDGAAAPCGERAILASDETLAIARMSGASPLPVEAAVLIVGARTGKVIRSVPTSADPVDLVAAFR